MDWICWTIGILWVFDGFLYFVFPSFVRQLFIRAYQEERLIAVSIGPALCAALLWIAAPTALHPWGLKSLSLLSFLQFVYLAHAIKSKNPNKIEWLIALSNRTYRLWGMFLTGIGPTLFGIFC